MRNTPSSLKWLAEQRARLSADVTRLEKLETELAQRLAQAKDSLGAIDKCIRLHTPGVDPSVITPVSATKGKYGKHGALRASIEKALASASPDAIATDELALFLVLELGLDFTSGASPERARWVKNSLSPTLRAMVDDGIVERAHDASVFTSEVGRWKLKVEKQPTLKEVREAAKVATAATATTAGKPAVENFAANDEGVKAVGKRKARFRF